MLILGTVQFGLDYGINNSAGRVNLEEVHNILEFARNNGINVLDTAPVYGNAHEIIGAFHLKSEFKFNIITKLADGSNFENFNHYISKFLEELEVDTIDTLMFHNFQDYQKNLNSIHNLRKYSTKINKIGVSVYSNAEVLSVAIDKAIDVIQMPYNLLDNFSLRAETLKFAKEKGKIVHTRSAFLQGLFFMNHNSTNMNYLNLKEDILKLRSIADELGYTINELALIYCLNNKYSDGVIIGVDSTEHLKKNVECLNIKLPDSATERIEKIIIKNYNLINPKLWV